LIAVLDADFAPCWNFLYRTVGFFHDPRVAILQTPQYFHNPDPIQSNLGLTDLWPDDQRLFFDVILPSRDAWGCAWCCGTGSVIRREAIEAIGGVPTDSITEDLLSTLVLMRRGYLTRYLNERLCTGLAPESLKGFFQQRERWCRGNLQILFLKAGPLGPGLTLFQRLMFLPLDWVIQYVGRLMTVLVPIVFLWTGIGPFRIPSLEDLISYQVPVFLSALGVIRWFAPNSYLPIISTASCLFSSFRIVPTGLATLIKPFGTPFKVTPKGSSNTFSFGDFMILTLALGLMALTVGGLIKNRVAPADLADHGAFLIVAEAWAVVNLFLLAVAALIAIESPPPPDAERRPCGVAAACRVQGEEFPCRVLDLSVSEASLEGEVPLRADTLLELVLDGVGTLPGRVLRAERNQAEVAFDDRPGPHRDRLIQYVYTAGRTNLVPSVHGWKVMTGLVKAFWRS
jgi:cellulose synthase (UDP-forming)